MQAQTKRRQVVYILLLLIITIAIVIGGWIDPIAYADIDTSSSYDKTNAYDDLRNSEIGGKAFSLSDYPKDEKGSTSVISFTEYCYSTVADKQAYFGLYVYIYNPSENAIDETSTRNRIQLCIGASEVYKKYNLVFLNYSTDKACEKRFYKFRIEMSYGSLQSALKELDADTRVYSISGVELSYSGTVTEYACAQTYTYSGYGKGCAENDADDDTLTCTVDGFDRYVNLDVKHTEYRAKGDYYNGEQSQLNSVYFRVPNKYFTDYGDLTEITCEWWEYFTKPLLVSNDVRTVNAVNSLYGRNTMDLSTDNYYLFMALWSNITSAWFKKDESKFIWTSNRDYSDDWYRFDFLWGGSVDFTGGPDFGGYAAAFYSDNLTDIDSTLTGDVVLERLRSHSEKLGGEKIRDRYSKALFEDFVQNGYNMGYNRKSIKQDDKMEVFWNSISTKNIWAKMFTGEIKVDTEYDELNAITTIKASDVSGSDKEIASALYINENDVSAFKAEYAKAQKNNETLVLFRFSTTKYFSCPTAEAHCAASAINSGSSDGEILVNDCYSIIKDRAWNGYTVQETVYLDFDIISLTYTSDDVETVIPVVSSPIDIAGGLTPPLKDPLDTGRDWSTIVKIVLGVIIGILALWLLNKLGVLTLIGKGIVFIVTAPFKAISSLFKRSKNKSDGSVNVTFNIPNKDKQQSEDKQ